MITRDFLLAGRAIFTVSTSERHYTFSVTSKKASGKYPPAWFVALLTGANNERDYTYLGLLDVETGRVRLTKGSKYSEDSVPVRVVRVTIAAVYGVGVLPEDWTAMNVGKCGRCRRLLSTPESIARGLGPECVKKGR